MSRSAQVLRTKQHSRARRAGGVGLTAIASFLLIGSSLAEPTSPTGPATFTPPESQIILAVHAVGAQIYQCRQGSDGANAWRFREPVAALFKNGESVGRHFVGPAWGFADGAVIKAKLVVSQPGAAPADVPLLRLKVSERPSKGALADASWVFRLNTRGGVRSGACAVLDDMVAEPYSADYVFAR